MMPVDKRPFLIHVHAFLAARNAVKDRLKREGHIVSQYKASAITELAKQLLAANRERMLAEAKQRIMHRAEYQRAGEKFERQLAKQQARLAKRHSRQ
jgi:hypothetical protein